MSFSEENLQIIKEQMNMFIFNAEKLRYVDPITNVITITLVYYYDQLGKLDLDNLRFFDLLEQHYFREFPKYNFRFLYKESPRVTGHYTMLLNLIPHGMPW